MQSDGTSVKMKLHHTSIMIMIIPSIWHVPVTALSDLGGFNPHSNLMTQVLFLAPFCR